MYAVAQNIFIESDGNVFNASPGWDGDEDENQPVIGGRRQGGGSSNGSGAQASLAPTNVKVTSTTRM